MKTSKIFQGAEVNSKKNGHGIITRIITKSTGYVEVSYDNGSVKKEMAFNLTDNEGNALKATPKKRESEPTMAERIQSWKQSLLHVNDKWNNASSLETTEWVLRKLNIKGNDFLTSLVNQWMDKFAGVKGARFFSEKQAYYLAKACVEQGI